MEIYEKEKFLEEYGKFKDYLNSLIKKIEDNNLSKNDEKILENETKKLISRINNLKNAIIGVIENLEDLDKYRIKVYKEMLEQINEIENELTENELYIRLKL